MQVSHVEKNVLEQSSTVPNSQSIIEITDYSNQNSKQNGRCQSRRKGAEGFYGQKDLMNALIDHLVLRYCHSLTRPEPTCQMGILIVNESFLARPMAVSGGQR